MTRQLRAGPIVRSLPLAPHAPLGTCRWCGELIEFSRAVHPMTKRRRYHRGDRVETQKRRCNVEYAESRVWSPRFLIHMRKDPACVDCGSEGDWDADHDVPLWKGGTHSADNIVRRCTACHKAKTAREAAERSQMRRASGLVESLESKA